MERFGHQVRAPMVIQSNDHDVFHLQSRIALAWVDRSTITWMKDQMVLEVSEGLGDTLPSEGDPNALG